MGDVFLGFDFGGTKVIVATADDRGRIISREEFLTQDFVNGYRVMEHALATGQCLVSRLSTTHRLVAIGVSSMGLTLPGGVLMAPNVPDWAELRMYALFQDAFPTVPTFIENDVKVATLAELRLGELKDTDSGMFVNLGTGIAIGYTLGDKLMRGSHGVSGEIGYALLCPNEPQGYRDGSAPFEEFAGGGGLGRRATARFGQPLSTKALFARAASDPEARQFLDEALDMIAFQITNAVIAYDPEKVVIGGGMVASQAVILPRFADFLQRFVPFPPILTTAWFKSDAGIYGAITLARDSKSRDTAGSALPF